MREILYNSDTNKISLEKELRILKYYLNILDVHFSNDLKITKNIDGELLSQQVPALILQPLIKDSIKHWYSYDHPELEVLISVKSEGKYLAIKVENNGALVSFSSEELVRKE